MKRFFLFFILFVFGTISNIISEISPNPIISRGKPVFTSRGRADFLADNKYKNETWYVTDTCWIAISLKKGPSKVFVNWNNPEYAWSNELAPAKCPNSISFPVDYDVLTSANSTNGLDGKWKVVCSIRGNIVSARGHLVDFKGAKWVKIKILKGGGSLDEVEVFDASKGLNDSWFFVGTSISANTYKGTPPAENYADLINKKFPGFSPAMVRGGIGCISSNDFAKNLSKYLRIAGNVKYWAIEMGTNDAWNGGNKNVATFKQNLKMVVDSCKSIGIQPIIAKVLATNQSITNWQVDPEYQKAIEEITMQNKLIEGPDLYSWFLAHPEELQASTDGVHPNALGAASIQRLWAEKMEKLYSAGNKKSK